MRLLSRRAKAEMLTEARSEGARIQAEAEASARRDASLVASRWPDPAPVTTPQEDHQTEILRVFQSSARLLAEAEQGLATTQETTERLMAQARQALKRAQDAHTEARRRQRAVSEGRI